MDKLAAIREVHDIVTDILANAYIISYTSGPDVTIDEGMTAFKWRCPIKIYMPNKPDKYGIKNFMMVDSFTH